MLKKILSGLFHRDGAEKTEEVKRESVKPPVPPKEPRSPLGNGMYWEFDSVPNGYGGYKNVNVWLLKVDDPDFRRCIVNRAGDIQHFPGFKDRAWESALDIPAADQRVKFVFWISPYQDGKARVRWLIQPDGRYFEDEDGFGAEHCDEIEVYSFLDEQGRFTEPFSRQ